MGKKFRKSEARITPATLLSDEINAILLQYLSLLQGRDKRLSREELRNYIESLGFDTKHGENAHERLLESLENLEFLLRILRDSPASEQS